MNECVSIRMNELRRSYLHRYNQLLTTSVSLLKYYLMLLESLLDFITTNYFFLLRKYTSKWNLVPKRGYQVLSKLNPKDEECSSYSPSMLGYCFLRS